MTKYILHGGNTREVSENNDSFFKAVTDGLTSRIHVLLVYFAREEQDIHPLVKEDSHKIQSQHQRAHITFEVAEAEKLVEQIQKADVIYIRGGVTQPLLEQLGTIKTLRKLFDHKVVVGSSAGCYVLAQYYWDNSNGVMGEGLGLLPIKSICHYTAEDDEAIKQFPKQKDELPLLVLPDHRWTILFY